MAIARQDDINGGGSGTNNRVSIEFATDSLNTWQTGTGNISVTSSTTYNYDGTATYTIKAYFTPNTTFKLITDIESWFNIKKKSSYLSCSDATISSIKESFTSSAYYCYYNTPTATPNEAYPVNTRTKTSTNFYTATAIFPANETKTVTIKLSFDVLDKYNVITSVYKGTKAINLSINTMISKSTVVHKYDEGDYISSNNNSPYTIIKSGSYIAPSLSKLSDTETGHYTISWYDGNNKLGETDSSNYAYTITYNDFIWKSTSGFQAKPGATIRINNYPQDINFYASSTASTPSYSANATIGSDWGEIYKDGYTFKHWVYKGTTQKINLSSSINKDISCEAYFIANKYYVVFDVSDSDKKQRAPQKLTKTYGTNLDLPALIFTKNGYKQVGWTDGSNDFITVLDEDPIYGSETPIEILTLYPKWEAILNTANYNYYIEDSASMKTDKITYTIEDYSGNISKNLPTLQFSNDRHVFLGWCKEKPTDWDSTKGVYRSLNLIDKSIFSPDVITFDNTAQWDPNATIERFGVWTPLTKWIKLADNEWHKISGAYYKTETGWQPIIIYNKADNGWHGEVQGDIPVAKTTRRKKATS